MTPSSSPAERPAIKWQWSAFEELSPGELYAALALRQRVFVVEQDCVYQDTDGRDAAAWHLLGWSPAAPGENLLAYARVFAAGVRYPEVSIGRIVTAPEMRGLGLGKQTVEEAMRRCAGKWPAEPIRIAAQRRLEKFYAAFGFIADGAPYVEDGIDHIDMVRPA